MDVQTQPFGEVRADTRLYLTEINKFINDTHNDNLFKLMTRLYNHQWHWMFPDHWENNAMNRAVLFNAINSYLGSKAV